MSKTVFETLSHIDFKQHIKTLQGNKYIPWSDAWFEVKKAYPLAWYEIREDDIGNPFFVSPMGIFVKVVVYVGGEEPQSLHYPVLNGANKALKAEAYSYKVKEYINKRPTGKMVDKYVEAATSFDINTAHMRALTKCLALKGAALYVYRDEVMPEPELLDSTQLQEIVDKIKEKGLTLTYVAKSWQIEAVAKFHASNFDNVMNWLDNNKFE